MCSVLKLESHVDRREHSFGYDPSGYVTVPDLFQLLRQTKYPREGNLYVSYSIQFLS